MHAVLPIRPPCPLRSKGWAQKWDGNQNGSPHGGSYLPGCRPLWGCARPLDEDAGNMKPSFAAGECQGSRIKLKINGKQETVRSVSEGLNRSSVPDMF